MAKLVIIRGNSGSGKSTLANELQKRLGQTTMLIQQDVIRREVLRVRDGSKTLAIDLIKRMAEYGADHCDRVIIEGILYTKWYGEMLEELFPKFETVYTYYYDLSFEETVRRHQTKSNREDFSIEDMKRWWNEHDVLNNRGEKLINEKKSVEETLQLILKNVIK